MSASTAPPLDLGRLRLFVQVAELGSLTKAAVMLDTAQPAISRQIGQIEREWGGRLFHRTGRGVALTELGERILPRAKALLAQAGELAEDIKGTAGVPSGDVRIGVLPSLSQPLISQLFRRTRASFPKVRLHIFEGSTGQIEEWLASDRIDIAIRYRYGRSLPRGELALAAVDTCLIGGAGDPVTRSPTVRFARLDRLPLVLPGPPNALRVLLDQTAKRLRISLAVVMEADSLPLQTEAAAENQCYTILPVHAVHAALQAGRVQASRIVSPGIARTIALGTTTQRPLNAGGREAVKLVREIVSEMVGTGPWQRR
jgi:LysR family transcriptional regulator, nitrogen assimilation regulatory protein